MNLINLKKTNNNYISNWTNSYNNTIFIMGTVEPFTYKAEETDAETDEMSWCILDEVELNQLKSKL